MNDKLDLSYFPYQKYYPNQKKSIEKIFELFNIGYNNILLQSPTGTGKSVINYTIAKNFDNAYILTSQKFLQDQYIKDFKNKIGVIKGRSNYLCYFWNKVKNKDLSCSDCVDSVKEKCYKNGVCLYHNTKIRAAASDVTLMNYKYFFLLGLSDDGFFKDRELIICDETHSLESEIMSIIEFKFSERNRIIGKKGIFKIPEYNTVNKYINWIIEQKEPLSNYLYDAENRLISIKEKLLGNVEGLEIEDIISRNIKISNEDSSTMKLLNDNITKTERLLNRIEVFERYVNSVEWVFTLSEDKQRNKTISFKPVTINKMFNDMFSKYMNLQTKMLFTSATIGDKNVFCRSFGLDCNKTEIIDVPSSFPIKNRRIHKVNIGFMNQKNIDKTLPAITDSIKSILESYPNSKGLVHTWNYKISNYIEYMLQSFNGRLLYHNKQNNGEKSSREKMLEKFFNNDNKPLVIVSPSLTDGLDLKYDLCDFQIIVKLPYASLGDKQVKRRLEIDSEWYNNNVAIKLVQMSGRGVRAVDDHAETFILDSGFDNFLRKNNRFFPKYFLEAISDL